MDIISFLIFLFIISIFVIFSETLYQLAGEDKKVWYYLVLLMPPLLIIYHITNWK